MRKKYNVQPETVDLSKLPQINKIVVEVDGQKTPLSIGDKIVLSEDDANIKTVVAIQINEDGKILYTLERATITGEIEQQLVSITELKLLANNIKKKLHIVGLNANN